MDWGNVLTKGKMSIYFRWLTKAHFRAISTVTILVKAYATILAMQTNYQVPSLSHYLEWRPGRCAYLCTRKLLAAWKCIVRSNSALELWKTDLRILAALSICIVSNMLHSSTTISRTMPLLRCSLNIRLLRVRQIILIHSPRNFKKDIIIPEFPD